MRVTVIQMTPGHVVEANLSQMRELVERACQADRPDLVVLPEMWSCLGGSQTDKRVAAEHLPATRAEHAGPLYQALRNVSREQRVVLHGGSIGELSGDQLFNTTLVFAPDGHELARYRKIHLFDVVVPGGATYRESDTFGAGDRIVTFEAAGLTVGCAICYDLRFGYLFDSLRARGAELIVLPAAFTAETGQAHWDVLVRARAIETQSWVAAAATAGAHSDGQGGRRSTFGHSMVCDPWGTVVAQASAGAGWTSATVEPALTERVRRDMPVWQHRRSL